MADPLSDLRELVPRESRGLRLASAALFLAGVAGGVLFDPTPARPEVYRGGYRVLEGDFHVHTTLSDGSLTPLGVVRQAERRGLDVIAVTEHNSAWPSAIARGWARIRGADTPIVLRGEEITSKRFHVVAVGVEDTVSPSQPLAAVIAEVHRQHGVAIAAHPVRRYWEEYEAVRGSLDGSELMHPIAYARGPFSWRWEDLATFYERNQATLMPIGSSDYHWGSILGLCRTYVFVKTAAAQRPTEDDVMEALRAKRTVVLDRDGRAYGDPTLTALVVAEAIPRRAEDYRYRGEGAGDRVLRALGFIGLVGLVVIGKKRRRG